MEGRIVPLLDQFDLEIARVGERDADFCLGGFAAIAEPVHLHALDIIEGADAQHLGPMLQCGFDVAHDIAVLADLSENPAHGAIRKAAASRRIASASGVYPRSGRCSTNPSSRRCGSPFPSRHWMMTRFGVSPARGNSGKIQRPRFGHRHQHFIQPVSRAE